MFPFMRLVRLFIVHKHRFPPLIPFAFARLIKNHLTVSCGENSFSLENRNKIVYIHCSFYFNFPSSIFFWEGFACAITITVIISNFNLRLRKKKEKEGKIHSEFFTAGFSPFSFHQKQIHGDEQKEKLNWKRRTSWAKWTRRNRRKISKKSSCLSIQ